MHGLKSCKLPVSCPLLFQHAAAVLACSLCTIKHLKNNALAVYKARYDERRAYLAASWCVEHVRWRDNANAALLSAAAPPLLGLGKERHGGARAASSCTISRGTGELLLRFDRAEDAGHMVRCVLYLSTREPASLLYVRNIR